MLPFVSVCTPTFNRRPFIQIMIQCFLHQDYPMNRIEWIIVDDGTDKIKDIIESANLPQIQYYPLNKHMLLGEKRNYMHTLCKGDIIVYMDDDDYYPPTRISHAVETLQNNPWALCAGSSILHIFYKSLKTDTNSESHPQMVQFGPYGPNHATAGTFAFRHELLLQTKYDDTKALGEEVSFLKNYTIPFVQLDSMKTILCFSHKHNTADKTKIYEMNRASPTVQLSTKKVSDFIKGWNSNEKDIFRFFMKEVDTLLEIYSCGEPTQKPEVLKQTREIEDFVAKKKRELETQPFIYMRNNEDKPPISLTASQTVEILTTQQKTILEMDNKIRELEKRIVLLSSSTIQKQPIYIPEVFVDISSLQ